MKLNDIKDNLAQYQHSGNWNGGVHYLLDIYKSRYYTLADLLIVSELYWLMIDKDYLRTCSPDIYNSISWSFEEHFIDIFDTSRSRQERNLYYQWILGILISINPEPFFIKYSSLELRTISDEMASRGRILSISSDVQYLYSFTDSIIYGRETNNYNRKKLINELNCMNFRENMSDQNLKSFLSSLINRNSGIVDS